MKQQPGHPVDLLSGIAKHAGQGKHIPAPIPLGLWRAIGFGNAAPPPRGTGDARGEAHRLLPAQLINGWIMGITVPTTTTATPTRVFNGESTYAIQTCDVCINSICLAAIRASKRRLQAMLACFYSSTLCATNSRYLPASHEFSHNLQGTASYGV